MDETDGNHGPTCRLIEWFRPLSPCPPQAGCWCSRRERRPYVRLIVLGNGPRHASGLRTSDTGQTAGDLSPGKDPLTLIRSCEACSAFTRVAARTLARSPIRDPLYRRLQPFCHLHDCSGCFRLERLPGGTCTHWKRRRLSRRTPIADVGVLRNQESWTKPGLLEAQFRGRFSA